jgi:hypothetical protein
MKITKKELSEHFNSTGLEKFVLKDILEDCKNYEGSFTDRLKNRLSDISSQGCISGAVSMYCPPLSERAKR